MRTLGEVTGTLGGHENIWGHSVGADRDMEGHEDIGDTMGG